MNDIITTTTQLPENLPDLARFALVGREKLTAVRAEINAIKKVGLAKEVLEQKKTEAQEIAELVTLSEVKIGAMLREIPKATTNHKKTGLEFDTAVDFLKPKSETLKEIGIEQKAAERFQKMAEHEEIVHEASKDIPAAKTIVRRLCWRGEWHDCEPGITLLEYTQRFLNWIDTKIKPDGGA